MSEFPHDVFARQKFAVVGLGRNGFSAARALLAMGAEVIAWDDAAPTRDQAHAAGLHVAEPEMAGLDALVLSPGIPHDLPAPHPVAAAAIAAGVPILSDAELLYRAVRAAGSGARFVGITGTNGKSTTTALLAHLLGTAGITVAAGGNLGNAALSLPLLPQDAVYVLEMSSYMLERLGTLRFDAAAMLNLSPDHLDRHGNMDAYCAAKRQIFARQTADDAAVVGTDDAPSRAMASWLEGRGPRVVHISGHDKLPRLPATLRGLHNAQNAAAALALARAIGVSEQAVPSGLASFPGLPHRMERVGNIAGVEFVNDSKATNASSAATALDCFARVVWIAGGIAKAGGIETLQKWSGIDRALLIGRDAPLLAETLDSHRVPFDIVNTLEAAVPAAFARAQEGGVPVVLLSPACASFDQFADFEARGEKFRALVADLAKAA